MLGVTYGEGVFVAAGFHGIIYISEDGESWTQSSLGMDLLRAVAYGNRTFVAVGQQGAIRTWKAP
jgi:hypothetical protein